MADSFRGAARDRNEIGNAVWPEHRCERLLLPGPLLALHDAQSMTSEPSGKHLLVNLPFRKALLSTGKDHPRRRRIGDEGEGRPIDLSRDDGALQNLAWPVFLRMTNDLGVRRPA